MRQMVGWCVSVALVSCAMVSRAQESYSTNVDRQYPTTVYWGDTHLHTNISRDAYSLGCRLGPAEAYRFARGQPVTAGNGMQARLRRPLDFLVVADHAEYLGVMAGVETRDPVLLATDAGKRLVQGLEKISGSSSKRADANSVQLVYAMKADFPQEFDRIGHDKALQQSVWKQVAATADEYNDPGQFTAFIGYEWSSDGGGTQALGNLHRVVVFKDGAAKATQVLPFSALDSRDPEALWEYMAQYEKRTGGQVLAIPHNGNVSNGQMFSLQDYAGQALTRGYADKRSHWEPLYEVTQIKGDSEAHPFLSPTDEFADYEIWNSWEGKGLPAGRRWDDTEKQIKEGEYARSALKRGLKLQAQLGSNPFKFGLVGSTDAHTAMPAVEEDNFWGKAPLSGPSPNRVDDELTWAMPAANWAGLRRTWPALPVVGPAWQMASAGYAGVWATDNTREALFAAMKRRETYATTGPRMIVRFFGGWDYVPEDAARADLASIGYRKGVPMGGDLTHAPKNAAPTFLVRAVKDPSGANLDQAQIVKGWVDSTGEVHEKIFRIALSNGRTVDKDGKAPPVGSTVDVRRATYTNTIGVPELATVWKDPEFNPTELAFYYVRVIEIPTPRWTAYDARFFKIDNVPAQVPMVTQERGYTSPIWYTP
jgi:hypothetical protein